MNSEHGAFVVNTHSVVAYLASAFVDQNTETKEVIVMAYDYGTIVIGGGPGGLAAAYGLAAKQKY